MIQTKLVEKVVLLRPLSSPGVVRVGTGEKFLERKGAVDLGMLRSEELLGCQDSLCDWRVEETG